MKGPNNEMADRGQAYTLEGFISAMVLVMAVLFALQAVVLTPSTGGLADRSIQAQMQQEAQDALVVADQDGDLTETILYWDGEGGFGDTDISENPNREADNGTYSTDQFANVSTLGQIMNQSFAQQGWNYNVEIHYTDDDGDFETKSLVYQGSPSSGAQTASYTIAVLDDDQAYDGSNWMNVSDVNGDARTIPKAEPNEPVYNVVEVRLTIW
ncbi:DUF7288 family protein [Natrarchaeobaculum aegyptiacum]|uniref:Uncharacterized protein n=1 Tax=Natrarchaeobaculum aegyptiacum TaxID=745377 RepID=A0A2Z2HQE4_9EURY|nr:hypothetical protein [Natrarchaeobaculum aegyptiacum]ARS88873.1 hypothetical protein B1756_03290 [Natrarchaeobaculum aegyptiacum]